jgi:hypothetical protein
VLFAAYGVSYLPHMVCELFAAYGVWVICRIWCVSYLPHMVCEEMKEAARAASFIPDA